MQEDAQHTVIKLVAARAISTRVVDVCALRQRYRHHHHHHRHLHLVLRLIIAGAVRRLRTREARTHARMPDLTA